MARIKEELKENRKERVGLLIKQNNGIRQIELSKQLNLENRTIYNYLTELESEGKVYKEGLFWYATDHQKTQLRRFELPAEQAFTLYLAARLFVKQTDRRIEFAESVLDRLAEVLKSDFPVSPNLREASHKLSQRPQEPDYENYLQTLIRAYLQRCKVRLHYRPLKGRSFETDFSIYLIEPSAIGFATYIIGYSSAVNAIRSYKVSRIEKIQLLWKEHYLIPETFPGLSIFDTAWSIITGETTTPISLHFRGQDVIKRVLETNWHPSQKSQRVTPDILLWQVEVADTTDIFPWIRSWGSDVEILQPMNLRQQMISQLKKLQELYQIVPPTTRLPYQIPYAKTQKAEQKIHLLLYHLIDVGQVALALWETVLTTGFKQHIAQILNTTILNAGQFVAFLAALHDLGKAGPIYQAKYASESLKAALKQAQMPVQGDVDYGEPTCSTPHATVTTWALQSLLTEYCHIEPIFAKQIAFALGGHHGTWPTLSASRGIHDNQYPQWDQTRRDLVWEMLSVFHPPSAPSTPPQPNANIFLTLLSGITSVADWIASNEDYFPLTSDLQSTRSYANHSKQLATQALQKLGWIGWQPASSTPTFAQMFAYLSRDHAFTPRPIQTELIEKIGHLSMPFLLILEAPTGIGKTEKAFYLADKYLQQHQGRGIYIAMPTQATSNQMFDRFTQFLENRYPDQQINTLLVHGQADLHQKVQEIRLNVVTEDDPTGVVAMSWFMQKSKKTLLAPFGVGTVDQALLSILQTKHFFVRLFGLSHKVVIFDEVHAYDIYMSTLFIHLLHWLHAVGASVIILSATLPAETRQKLLKPYFDSLPKSMPASYPAVTIATAGQDLKVLPLGAPDDKSLEIYWLETNSNEEKNSTIVNFLRQELASGGCAAVICNTVSRAQELYQALKEAHLDILEEHLILFHARFPAAWRNEKEEMVLTLFGKVAAGKEDVRREPRFKAIVVATQVIEQSLDLDFDLMVTEMAPIDLLIQRAGRLHRHSAHDPRHHPYRLAVVRPPLDEKGLPNLGVNKFIYEEYVLLKSYDLLQNKSTLSLPSQTRALIEGVYGRVSPPSSLEWATMIEKAYRQMNGERNLASLEAKKQLIETVSYSELLWEINHSLEEDDPAVHHIFQAKTRDIAPTIALVCLHETSLGWQWDKEDANTVYNMKVEPSPEQVKELLGCIVTVQHWVLVNYFVEQEVPASWRKNGFLRYARPLILQNGSFTFSHNSQRFTLTLSRELGLQLTSEAI